MPSLIYFVGFSQKQEQGTSPGILLFPIGIFAVMQNYKQGHINLQFVLLIAVNFIIASLFGSKLATTSFSDEKLRGIFGIT